MIFGWEYRTLQVSNHTALRTAVEKGDGTLDKEATSHDDLVDAFRLSLQFGINHNQTYVLNNAMNVQDEIYD